MKIMKKILLYSIIAVIFSSCANPLLKNITKQLPPLEDNAEVIVYDRGDTVPENAEILGGIAFTCNTEWENMLEIAKKEARAAGGNGLEIQVRVNRYPSESPNKTHMLSAFILNVNDSIKPSQPTPFEKKEFQDYVVIKEGDTIPCSIVFESKSHLQFVYGYERHGNRKALSLPKQDLISYRIKNPVAFTKPRKRATNSFDILFGVDIDPGHSLFEYLDKDKIGFAGSGDVRFNIKKGTTLGVHYGFYGGGKTQIHFISGSFGVIRPISSYSNSEWLDCYLDGGVVLKPTSTKHLFSANIMFGYLFYKEDAEFGILSDSWGGHYPIICTISGRTFGIGSNVGYDYMLTDHFSIGATLGFVLGNQFKAKGNLTGFDELHSITGIDGPYSRTIYPNRVDLTFGLRYYL